MGGDSSPIGSGSVVHRQDTCYKEELRESSWRQESRRILSGRAPRRTPRPQGNEAEGTTGVALRYDCYKKELKQHADKSDKET